MRTLREALTGAYARAALEGSAGSPPSEQELHRAVTEATRRRLTPEQEKLLLDATLARFDPRVAANHLPAEAIDAPGEESDAALSVEHIAALTPSAWRACLAWLLAGEGYALEELGHDERSVTWRGHAEESHIVAHAVRLPHGWLLDVEAVGRAAALAAATPGAEILLLSTSPAAVDALLAARRLGVRVWDRAAIGAALQRTD